MRILSFAQLLTSVGLLCASMTPLFAGEVNNTTLSTPLQSRGAEMLLARVIANPLAGSTAVFNLTSVAAAAANACDLNQDAAVNIVDVQQSVNMYLGTLSCTATVEGSGVCNQDVINRIKTAALGGTCVTGPGPHSVTLNWSASTTPNISGYNLYRSATSGGPYKKVTSSVVAGTSYVDYNVDGGFTYYYVATAVDSNSVESAYSNQATAVVPAP